MREFGLGGEQILLAQLVQHVGDLVLSGPSKFGEVSRVALAVTMPPDAGSDRAQTMSGVALLIVKEELLTDRLFKETFLTCIREREEAPPPPTS